MSSGLMTFEEYAKQARVTATYAHNGSNAMAGVMYAGLGLSDEFVEFLNAITIAEDSKSLTEIYDVYCEAGDVLWYVFNLCQDFSIDIKHMYIKNSEYHNQFTDGYFINRALLSIGSICGIIKKQYRDRNPSETETLPIIMDDTSKHNVQFYLNTVVDCVSIILKKFDEFQDSKIACINKAMQLNIEKLTDRVNRGVLYGSGDHR